MSKADQTIRVEYLKALQECKRLRATEKDCRKTIAIMAQEIDRLRDVNVEMRTLLDTFMAKAKR